MILALLWLTVSLPFVIDNQKRLAAQEHIDCSSTPLTEEEAANPFGNGTEEKISQ